MQNTIQHDSLSQPVYDRLKKMIQDGKLSPGQKLLQEKLAAELGVSRTPLLKAFQRLEHEMLVESIPRKGMYVKNISPEEMLYVYECREAVESMAIRLLIDRATDAEIAKLANIFSPFKKQNTIDIEAYRKADEKFHDMIILLSKNPVLKRMSKVSDIHKRVYKFGLVRPPEETMAEHISIVEAIKNRDAAAADRELRNHISLSKEKIT